MAIRGQVMPKYYFHLWRDGTRFADNEGQTLRDPDEAWEAARATALGIMKAEADSGTLWTSCSFEVTDVTGQVILEFPFREAIETKTQPS
jgi:hypothetical protein